MIEEMDSSKTDFSLEDEEKLFTYLWQKRNNYKEDKLENKADSLRYSLTQVEYLQQNFTNDFYYAATFKKNLEILDEYSKIIDNQETGLNNYASNILYHVRNSKNESKSWISGLDADKIASAYIDKTPFPKELDHELMKFSSCLKDSESVQNINEYPKKKESIVSSKSSNHVSFELLNNEDINKEVLHESSIIGNKKDAPCKDLNVQNAFLSTNLQSRESEVGVVSEIFSYFKPQEINHEERNVARRYERKTEAKGSYPWNRVQNTEKSFSSFRTAADQLTIENVKKQGSCGNTRKSLGTRRSVTGKFVPPVKQSDEAYTEMNEAFGNEYLAKEEKESGHPYCYLMKDERLKNIEPRMVELVLNEIMDSGTSVTWDDIAGLEIAKSTIQEIVVWPMLRPDIFTGLRGPPRGILLFGPPGTGKTMIGKCIASQSKSTFFSISASSLTSKWIGEGEKMVRALFTVARCCQPAVIFIDEIDSLLTQRSDSEHESSRRIKTEFLVQLDGATTGTDERILLVGATNRPQELDEAARRRLVKRLYIPLPDSKARVEIIKSLLSNQNYSLISNEIEEISHLTEGYSGADMASLCREAAMGPIRAIPLSDLQNVSLDKVRPILIQDFMSALKCIRASVSGQDLSSYEEWNKKYGIAMR